MSQLATATTGARNGRPAERPRRHCKVAYIMSRFPALTETFVLYEILEVQRRGVEVELFPLLRIRTNVMHPEAAELVRRAHFQPFLSWPILRANLGFILRKPRVYFAALWALLRGTWGSFRFFTGAVAIFPKTVHFARLMEQQGVTHVHAHFANHPAAAAFVIRRLTGIPYSFTAHGSDLHRDRHMLREKVAEAAVVITISEYNRRLIVAECGEPFHHKVAVIHCGVDTENLCPSGEDAPTTRQDGPLSVTCIGTLHEVKGQTHLIEACRLLRQRGLDVHCHLIGDGPDRKALFAQVSQSDLADRIRFHGWRTRAEIIELLRQADVLAAPSVPSKDGRREGIPVALMEAMACGVPVVASELSGIPELVRHGQSGLLVPPGDAAALADAIQRLHADRPLHRRLAQGARETVQRDFDLSKNAAALTSYFHAGGPSCS
ncbi:MAG TPA: glycosyltransferase family 4 protein [Thermoguttaceae bacterium]|nr:glycosyltransferase family 4 protein [Thermoguttaceae bacterium]